MPLSNRLFTFHATAAYRGYLDTLRTKLGLTVPAGDYLKIVEAIVAHSAKGAGLTMPDRVPKTGGARPGAGRKPKATEAPPKKKKANRKITG